MDRYREENPEKFKLWYTVSKSVKSGKTFFSLNQIGSKSIFFFLDWKYDTGRIDEEMLTKHLPAAGKDTLILICGPTGMVKDTCLPALEKLGYSSDMLFVC